jgi:hypothetical protein
MKPPLKRQMGCGVKSGEGLVMSAYEDSKNSGVPYPVRAWISQLTFTMDRFPVKEHP